MKLTRCMYWFVGLVVCLVSVAFAGPTIEKRLQDTYTVMFVGMGDSLTHGTMDATNNLVNTQNAYLQRLADALSVVLPIRFSQPYYGFREQRLRPFIVPTNIGIDGSDIFSLEGIEYYKRVGATESYVTEAYLCNSATPLTFQDDYDKVMYPLNRIAGKSVSQIDASLTLLKLHAEENPGAPALVLLWIGNNDTSLAALGAGGSNPSFLPLPVDAISKEITPALLELLEKGKSSGQLSFEPYSRQAIERNMTDIADFDRQFNHILSRLHQENPMPSGTATFCVLTLPYYSAVGYLFDSDDIEWYLKQIDPAYQVPPTFKRVAEPGQPITKPFSGDRVSLFTFACMYALMNSGYSAEQVNAILEKDGVQQDGLVLSEEEQQVIMSRIDAYNQIIRTAASAYEDVVLIDIGPYLNSVLGGETAVTVSGKTLSRKWSRGSAFSLDGVHPGYTAQALIANQILSAIQQRFQVNVPLIDVEQVFASDPYIDRDGDGWVPGPDYPAHGLTELLFLFTDPNDQDFSVKAHLPPNFWRELSRILLKELLGIPGVKALQQMDGAE